MINSEVQLGWRFGPLSQDVTYSEGVFENEHVASDMENLTNHCMTYSTKRQTV